jgi:type I restriction enzyme, S subunit
MKKNKHTLTPKLRFPEFRDRPGWEEKPLEAVCSPVERKIPKPDSRYIGLGIRSHSKGTFLKPNEDPSKNSMEHLYEVGENDLILNITFAWEGAIAIAQPTDTGALVSHRFPTYVLNRGVALPEFYQYRILNKRFIYELGVISPGGAGRNRVLNKTDFLKLKLAIPELKEQQKIAECLSSLDGLIAAEGRKLAALRDHKRGLMQQLFPQPGQTQPRLRFPEFRNKGEWQTTTVGEAVKTVMPPKRLLTSEYGDEGRFPIVDQSPAPDCGCTDDANAILTKGLPFTIFGDHTCVVKFVDQPFAQGADGIKILKARSIIDDLFLYFSLQARPLSSTQYKRHFTTLKEQELVYPDVKTGEQQRIAACLTALDTGIAAQAVKIESLKQHKRGLLQQLFPVPEEH